MAQENTTSNSFSTVLANFIRLQNNSIETLQKLSQATTSDSETVTVTIQNSAGGTATYVLPSFGYLKSSIERIDNTISTMLGFDSADAYIRMPDGSFKKIYQGELPTDPTPVGQLLTPTKFVADTNWFFESMMSPSLKVNFDVTQYIPQKESKIYTKRLILNVDTQAKIDYFDNELKGKTDVDYVTLLINLQKNSINYFVDEGVNDLPLSVVRYTGDFLVVNFEDRVISNPDGTTSTKRFYLFSTLNYSDSLSTSVNSMTLKVGDKLIKGQSIYEIAEIDISTRFLRVKRLSGYDPLVIGENVSFYSETYSPKIASVGIGNNERQVVFFKSINDEENLIGTKYSPGVAFYSNDLSIDLSTGTVTFSDFYRNNVADFGNFLLASAKEKSIAAVDGIVPDAPVLDAANFKVVQINEHKLSQAEIQTIKDKNATKVSLSAEINELQKSIDKLTEQLSTQKFNSATEKNSVKNQQENLIRERNNKSSLYSSIVQELAALAQNKPAALDDPIYRIRGFFAIPAPKASPVGDQQVVQFRTYYRYVSRQGDANNVEQFNYSDANGKIQRASFSNLVEVISPIRKKSYDTNSGNYVWASEDVTNPDAVNINQIDISITKGEKVEFYVVSVSEAGWPENPLVSANSNTITIEFPDQLSSEDEAKLALERADKEEIRVQVNNDLAAKGIDQHLSSSFTAAEKYYAHTAEVISSSFFDAAGNVISLFDKLNDLTNQIATLKAQIEQATAELSVFILDPDTNVETPVPNGNVITLFAGYYQDYQSLLPTGFRKGAIATKQYKIILRNNEATPLELVSKIYGGVAQNLPDSTTANTSYNDFDYLQYRKYDMVPVNNLGVGVDDTNNSNKISAAFFQSGQLRSQFMYSRFKDIGLVNDLYYSLTGTSSTLTVPTLGGGSITIPGVTRYYGVTFTSSQGPTTNYVWNGAAIAAGGTAVGGGYLTDFCVHIDSPVLNRTSSTEVTAEGSNLQNPIVTLGTDGYPIAPEAISVFKHAYGFEQQGTVAQPAKQLNYQNNFALSFTPVPTPAQTQMLVSLNKTPDKAGFVDSDRYLIGYKTCGAYLNVSPVTFDQLLVNGTDARGVKVIPTGSGSEISIPLTFQYRMEDFYGEGSNGNGIVGGFNSDSTVPPTNLTYARRVGLDVFLKNDTYSFDVIVYATYKKESLAQVISSTTPDLDKRLQDVTYTKQSIKTINT